MIFCNIWIGGKIPENRQRCIDSFKSLMTENDSYLILNNSFYETAIDSVENPDFWRTYAEIRVQYKADFMRFYLAIIEPELFYADTDVLFGNKFDISFKQSGAYVGQWGAGAEPFLFYVNQCCDFFKNMMEYVESFNPKRIFLPFKLQQFFRKNKYNKIDEQTFSHQRMSKYNESNI